MRWLLLVLGLVGTSYCTEPVATVTRTQLKVGRNLRPTETLEVRTKNGDIAKLIVKRRENRTPSRQLTNVRLPKSEHLEGVPNPVDIRSEAVYVKGEAYKSKRGRSVEVDKDGIPVVTGVRVPDDPSDRVQVWRNARVINNVLVQGQQSDPVTHPPVQTEWVKVEPANATPVGGWNHSPWRQVSPPQQQQQVTDKILEYIKNINRQEVLSRQAETYNRLTRGIKEEPKIEARVLHTPSAVVYPTSSLYSPASQKNKVQPVIDEGIRTPVLQYAHPELGVQAAVTRPERNEGKLNYGRDKGLSYYPHSDRNPYSYEPGLDDEVRTEDFSYNDKRSNSDYTRPKKHLDYFPQQQSYGGYGDKYYNKYGPYKDSYIKYVDLTDRRPFWEKLGDSLKEHVEYGMERVSDLARPVVDPLVEATHKISENLGFHMGTRKVGYVGAPSMLLPALGLVAGGAALGLGAVAVGRYLDVDLLSRSQKGQLPMAILHPMDEKRAIEAAQGLRAVERVKRGLAHEDQLQDLEHIQRVESGPFASPQAWANTPCAKKIFCQVMLSQPHDDVALMEKKMAAFLRMVEPKVADAVREHLDDVMQAIRKGTCAQFQCQLKISPSPR